jgi:hypothetical protein
VWPTSNDTTFSPLYIGPNDGFDKCFEKVSLNIVTKTPEYYSVPVSLGNGLDLVAFGLGWQTNGGCQLLLR